MSDLITSSLDRRFLLSALVPVLALAGWLGLLVATPSALATWERQGAAERAMQVVLSIIALVLAATLLSSQRDGVLRLFEGYWCGPLDRTLGELGRRHHRRRARRMAQRAVVGQAAFAALRARYPSGGRDAGEAVMPTALGNVLAAAEAYPWVRYRIDAVVVWPRLYPLLPDRVIGMVAAARADVDFLAACSLFGITASVAGGAIEWAQDAAWWQFAGALWAPAIVAGLCYAGALRAADTYADGIRVVFDLYRSELLRQLGLLPDKGLTAATEQQLWLDLSQFWYRGIPLGTKQVEPPSPAQQKAVSLPGSRIPLWAWLSIPLISTTGIWLAVRV